MQGKRVRTEGESFLGKKYREFTCRKCNETFQDIGLDQTTICGNCDNPEPTSDDCGCWSCRMGTG